MSGLVWSKQLSRVRKFCWRRSAARCAIALLAIQSTAWAATPGEIQKAIDSGKQYLFDMQKDGNWEVVPKPDPAALGGYQVENTQYGGLTSIATFSLLASGVSAQDPHIKQAIAFLKKTEIHGTYALGLRCQIWNMVPLDDSIKQVMRHDRDLLVKGISGKVPNIGFYGYDTLRPGTESDHSASQFGVLGLWAVNQAGAEVPSEVWRAFDNAWRSQQLAGGCWSYRFSPEVNAENPDLQPTLSMTAAGVATLFITQDYTHLSPQLAGNIDDPATAAGVKWLGDHLAGIEDDRRFYTLFGVSRVGLACGYKYLGKLDWFQFGADQIVKMQHPEGFWASLRENPNNVVDTSFALLFLSRGRAPIMMNKLKYDVVGAGNGRSAVASTPGTWNQRPRDVANLTRMVGRQLEVPLNWQIVTLRQKKQDLHDAPILYMSGSTAPKLSDADRNTLKEYIEDGGLVFGHSDGSSLPFNDGFRKLGEAMFPGKSFRVVPADRPIYVAENFPRSSWSIKPALEGLNNGVREVMLLLPAGDPAKVWQSQTFPTIRKDVFGQLAINMLLYASDQEGLRQRDQTYLLNRDDSIQATKTLKLARLQYTGDWNPEPGGFRRLITAMHNDRKIDLEIHPLDAGASPGSTGLNSSYQAAHLSILGNVSLSEPARKAIHDYVEAGGTLLVDVPGGAGVDRTTAETELAKIFPDAPRPLPTLPMNSPVYSAGHQIKEVAYRHYAKSVIGNLHTPKLCGWTRPDGRIAIIYSGDDISAGLVGEQMGGIVGYAPESATRIMENMLTYAGSH